MLHRPATRGAHCTLRCALRLTRHSPPAACHSKAHLLPANRTALRSLRGVMSNRTAEGQSENIVVFTALLNEKAGVKPAAEAK